MARRTKEKAEQTRQNILDAALDVFACKGFVRATLNDIARAAGVTRGAVYWHFKDKADLFTALSQEIEASTGIRPEDIVGDDVRTLKDLRDGTVQYLANFENNRRFSTFYETVNYKTEYTAELEPVLLKERQKMREIIQRLAKLFVRLQSKDRVRSSIDPDRAALSLVAFVAGLIEIWLFDRQSFSMTETAPPLLDDFLRAMIAKTEGEA